MSLERKKAKLNPGDEIETMELADDASAAAAQGVTSISLISPETRQTSNRDALLRLRPIVLGLQDNSYDDLCRSLGGMRDFLQVTSVSRDKGEISNVLSTIYIELRKLEAASVPTEGDGPVDEKYRNTAIEIRNAILFSNLEEIPGGDGVKFYQGFVPNLLLKSNCRPRIVGWAKSAEIKRGKEYYNVTLTVSLSDVLVSDW